MLEGFVEVTAILNVGVYALLRNDVVVYVGQSKKMLGRIYAHRTNHGRKTMPSWMPVSLRGVQFDRVYVLPCRLEDLDALERSLIDLYKPRYNIKLKSPTPVDITPYLRTNGPINTAPGGMTPLRFERRI